MDISPIKETHAEEAKQIVLEGFKERFGHIIEGLNPDLDDISSYYQGDKYFYIGVQHGEPIATGALIFETPDECRIVRMSVRTPYRNKGLGGKMLSFLEGEAFLKKAGSIILETNKEWDDAIALYEKNGYSAYFAENERIHFRKKLNV
ncbi:GNAT family N-acetyltransferase [Bacillus sp. AK031]